jgi:uncharacterized protein
MSALRPLAAASFIFLALTGASMSQTQPQRVIETAGSASVSVVPDLATIRIGVERTEKSSAKAFAGATTAINEVIESLKSRGVALKDISTSNLALSPVYDQTKLDSRGRAQIIGYSANVELSVISRDISKTGQLLDAALKEGSNLFNGIYYDISDRKPALDEARRQAAAEAKRKAELYAAALSLKLGPILRVHEPGAASPQPFGADTRMEMPQAAAAVLNVQPGQMEVTAEIGIVWSLAE